MPITYATQSLRAILPRAEVRKQDQRAGAYPVVAKTGDSSRTGRNKLWFDDRRTIVYNEGVNITYPTTFQTDTRIVGSDLTGSLGTIVGNVDKFATEQFVLPNEQVETLSPFREDSLFEVDETNVTNSSFMTGSAFMLAPDRFKSKLSNKTIIRMTLPLTGTSQMSTGSELLYYSPAAGGFQSRIIESSNNSNGLAYPPTAMAPLPFTPYGMHFLPLNDYKFSDFSGGSVGNLLNAPNAAARATTYSGDGSDPAFAEPGVVTYGFQTASVLNPAHRALPDQVIALSDTLAHPFLLEKIVIEMPFAAGPGWLNDRFGVRELFQDDLTYTADIGGPMITVGLMRQDSTGQNHRDLIASATITNRVDMQTGSYHLASSTYSGVGGFTDVSVTPEGVAGLLVNPSVVITGSVLSGTNNFFTGTLKFIMEPQITSHVLRYRMSGSSYFYWGTDGSSTSRDARNTMAHGVILGPIARRSSKYLASSRNVLGNHFALMDPNTLDGRTTPVNVMDSQYENLTSKSTPHRYASHKIYMDVRSNTIKSPYLLYPNDVLALCLSKHRAVTADVGLASAYLTPYEPVLVNNHDVAIPRGNVKITLYGDLIKEDTEFHDTLNQRLETVELWQTIGEDPVLDQFDVTYANELSGTYLDRFNVLNTVASINYQGLSSSLETTSYFSNFADPTTNSWSQQYAWSRARSVEDLKKSHRNANHNSSERFWDTRVPDPFEVMKFINPTLRLEGADFSAPDATVYSGNNFLYTGTQVNSGSNEGSISLTGDRSLRDWMMMYPYESKFDGLSKVFADSIWSAQRSFIAKFAGGGGSSTAFTVRKYLKDLNFIVGDDTPPANASAPKYRRIVGEPQGGTLAGVTFPEFIKIFYGIGDGRSKIDNQHVQFHRSTDGNGTFHGVRMRGWRYGMLNGFPMKSSAVFRRDRFGNLRDMLEQRLDTKFFVSEESFTNNLYTTVGVKEGPVQVRFFDRDGNITDPALTLSSNLSFEATSSLPYSDGVARNRSGSLDYATLNISSVTL